MANAEHVALVQQGTEAIARWRRKHPQGRLDLKGADLKGADLKGANLKGANLRGVNLRGVNLSGANLSGANLSGANLLFANLSAADLSGADLSAADLSVANLLFANLSGANLSGAHLREADLGGADLGGANLSWADLVGANLSAANLSGAVFGSTVLADSNLAEVNGLESIDHRGPSLVDHRTIAQSGELPLAFLRGVGLPDALIDFYRATYGKPVQFYSCFISYSHEDQQFADRLYANLQDRGVRCWKYDHDLKTGDRYGDVIEEAIRLHDKMLLVLSEHSLASDWVESEVAAAFDAEAPTARRKERRTVLFPVRLDDAVMDESAPAWAAKIRRLRHIGDFRAWKEHDAYSAALERLLRDLKPGTG